MFFGMLNFQTEEIRKEKVEKKERADLSYMHCKCTCIVNHSIDPRTCLLFGEWSGTSTKILTTELHELCN